MKFLETQLEIRQSTIAGAGQGLFTTVPIAKGSTILEYTGTITTLAEADDDNGSNPYLFYVTRRHVIDASKHKQVLGRYVNDARGPGRIKGFRNNSRFVQEDGKIYLEALRVIPAGTEILAHYGKSYWDIVRHNQQTSN